MKKTAKARIVTVSSIILFALVVLPPLLVRAENYTVGVKSGDWMKYGQFTVTWNGTGTEPSYVTEEKKLDWVRVDVENVSGTTVTLNFTIHYNNGTQTPQTMNVDVASSSMNGYFLIASNLKSGDNITSEASSSTINQTTTGTYAGATRNVNLLESTTVFQNQTTTSKTYWDQSTGIMVEAYAETPSYGYPGAYISVLIKATETNMWNADLIGTIASNLIYIIAAAIIMIVAVVAVVIFLRRKKLESPPPPPPPSQQPQTETGQWF